MTNETDGAPMNAKQRGFTLVELMIVLLIISILAGIAIPSYRAYVRRSDRAGAKTALTEDVQFMERNRTVSNRYDLDGGGNAIDDASLPVTQSPKDDTARYTITLTTLTATSFTLSAVPVAGGPMAGDECGSLTIDDQGHRGVTGTASVSTCWNK